MSLKPFVFAISLAAVFPAFAQDTSLSTELADIERQLTEIDAQAARYDGGLILTLIDARREALLLAKTLIENRINAEAGGATVEVTVPAVQPDESRAAQILGEMAAAQQRIEEAEREAATGGGLIQALALSRAETERLTLAQLQMGYLQAKYGIAFPVMAAQPSAAAPAAAPAADPATPPEGAAQTVAWADARFPAIDYTLAPFEQANRDGHRISGWWTIESTRAAVDDSPQIVALNHSQFQPNNFMGQTALVARCIEGETAFVFVQDDFLMNDFRRNSFEMTLRIDDQSSQQSRWSSLTNNQGAGLFGRDAEAFIRSIYDADRLFIRLVESSGQQHECPPPRNHPRRAARAASALPATALRGDVLPERVPAAGLLILRDGEPGEPEVTLSPLRYHYQHRAEIEAVVQGAARDAAFDTSAPASARRLPPTARWAASATGSRRKRRARSICPSRVRRQPEGGGDPVILHYSTAGPLA
jgi:hypothetical protein